LATIAWALAFVAALALATVAAIVAASAITAFGASIAAVFAAVPGVFAPVVSLSVSRCRHPGCRAQSGKRRYEGSFHVEAPVCVKAHPRERDDETSRLNRS
jgi:hypothetical protein